MSSPPTLANFHRGPGISLHVTALAPSVEWDGRGMSVAQAVQHAIDHRGAAFAADLAHWIAQMLYLRTWRPTERQLAAEAARHQAEEAHS